MQACAWVGDEAGLGWPLKLVIQWGHATTVAHSEQCGWVSSCTSDTQNSILLGVLLGSSGYDQLWVRLAKARRLPLCHDGEAEAQ